jgi:hypothetical protein
LAERVLGKDEVTSSILVIGSNLRLSNTPRLPSDAREKPNVMQAESGKGKVRWVKAEQVAPRGNVARDLSPAV